MRKYCKKPHLLLSSIKQNSAFRSLLKRNKKEYMIFRSAHDNYFNCFCISLGFTLCNKSRAKELRNKFRKWSALWAVLWSRIRSPSCPQETGLAQANQGSPTLPGQVTQFKLMRWAFLLKRGLLALWREPFREMTFPWMLWCMNGKLGASEPCCGTQMKETGDAQGCPFQVYHLVHLLRLCKPVWKQLWVMHSRKHLEWHLC